MMQIVPIPRALSVQLRMSDFFAQTWMVSSKLRFRKKAGKLFAVERIARAGLGQPASDANACEISDGR
jgi:hypothetical protein